MLAAAPAQDQSLELISLAFSLLASKRSDLPASLREHANKALHEAKTIYENPQQVSRDTLPESIELAFALINAPEVAEQLLSIDDVADLQPEDAERFLNALGE